MSESSSTRERPLWLVLIVASLIHAALFVWCQPRPDKFLLGDRAGGRLAKIEEVFESNDFLVAILATGGPGDYLPHGMLLTAGGRPLVVATQVALLLVSLALIYSLARRLSLPPYAAAIASTTYMLLPGTLVRPHVLATEGLFNPFVIISFYFLSRCLLEGRNRLGWVLGFGLFSAFASFLRPFFLLVPPLLAVFLYSGRRSVGSIVLASMLSISLPVGWSIYQYSQTGRAEIGGRGHGLSTNLYGRMERAAAIGGASIEPSLQEREKATPLDLLAYGAESPGAMAKTIAIDGMHFIFNTGINHVGGRFFGWFDMPEDGRHFRDVHDQRGLRGLAAAVVRNGSSMIVSNAAMLVGWLGFLLLAAWGIVTLARGPHRPVALCMSCLIVAILVSSQAASAVRWEHRSPAEFALAIGFGAVVARLASRRKREASAEGR